jgi:hypothetical protein
LSKTTPSTNMQGVREEAKLPKRRGREARGDHVPPPSRGARPHACARESGARPTRPRSAPVLRTGGRIQAAAARAAVSRVPSTCSNSARPATPRTVSGVWSVRCARDGANERLHHSPRRKPHHSAGALCWLRLPASVWLRRPRLSELRQARAQPPSE